MKKVFFVLGVTAMMCMVSCAKKDCVCTVAGVTQTIPSETLDAAGLTCADYISAFEGVDDVTCKEE